MEADRNRNSVHAESGIPFVVSRTIRSESLSPFVVSLSNHAFRGRAGRLPPNIAPRAWLDTLDRHPREGGDPGTLAFAPKAWFDKLTTNGSKNIQ
jgi:hypothetical protein